MIFETFPPKPVDHNDLEDGNSWPVGEAHGRAWYAIAGDQTPATVKEEFSNFDCYFDTKIEQSFPQGVVISTICGNDDAKCHPSCEVCC